MIEKSGFYTVMRCGDPIRNEWTNIGIILFDIDGKRIGFRVSGLSRAKARGDCQKTADPTLYYNIACDIVNKEILLNTRRKTSHGMNSIQFTNPKATLISNTNVAKLAELYTRFVVALPGMGTAETSHEEEKIK